MTHADPHLLAVSRFLAGLSPSVANVFCGTGPGGGVDPSCSPGGGGAAAGHTAGPGDPVTYTRHADAPAAAARARETHGPWAAALGPKETAALAEYQSMGYVPVNSSLRHPDQKLGWFERRRARRLIPLLDGAIASAPPLPHDAVMYRGLGAGLAGQLAAGTTFTDRGFTSLSHNRAAAEVFAEHALIQVRLPRGTRLASMDAALTDPAVHGESEYLLPRNSTFRVTGVGKNLLGRPVYTAELLP